MPNANAKTTLTEKLTSEMLVALRRDAASAGDHDTVLTAESALGLYLEELCADGTQLYAGIISEARQLCADIISEARAAAAGYAGGPQFVRVVP